MLNEQTDTATIPEIDLDPYDPAVLRDPHGFFELLREAGPVVRLSKYDVLAVGRHDEVERVLSDWEIFTTRFGIGVYDIRKPGQHRPPNPVLEKEPPDHTTVRRTITSILSPPVIRGWRTLFEQRAEAIAEKVLDERKVDVVEHVCEKFIFGGFGEVTGIDLQREATLAVSEMNFNLAGPANEVRSLSEQRAAPHLDWYAKSVMRENVTPGSVAAKMYEAEDKGQIPAGTAISICRLLIRAGSDTTISGLGVTFQQLATNPDQFSIVRSDLNRVKDAFEEAIRYESPSFSNYRTTTEDTVLAGVAIDKDVKIGAFIGAASRDSRKWDDPHKFDLNRRPAGKHLAFGSGLHLCLGQMIARLEAECILKAILGKTKELRLAATPQFRIISQLRTLDKLELEFVPA